MMSASEDAKIQFLSQHNISRVVRLLLEVSTRERLLDTGVVQVDGYPSALWQTISLVMALSTGLGGSAERQVSGSLVLLCDFDVAVVCCSCNLCTHKAKRHG
jgi:hypothetical protein